MLRILQNSIHQYAQQKSVSFKLLDQVQNRFKTQTLPSKLVCPRVEKKSPKQIFEFGGCEEFYTHKFTNNKSWQEENINYYEECGLKIVQAQYGSSVDSKAKSDLIHCYIPEYSLGRDISHLIFGKHLQDLLPNKGSLFFGQEQNLIRGLRFAIQNSKENISQIVISGTKPNLTAVTKWLMQINNLNDWNDIIRVEQSDVFDHLIKGEDKYDVIDIEVKGSSLDFLPGIIPSLNENGIISLLFTDFAFNNLSVNLKNSYTYYTEQPMSLSNDENVLRMIYYAINQICEMFDLTPEPIFYVSPGMYIKIYFKLKSKDQQKNKFQLICEGCQNTINATEEFLYQSKCQYCESNFTMSGPLWNGDLVNKEYLESIIDSMSDDHKDVDNRKTIISMMKDHINFSKINDFDELKSVDFGQLFKMMGSDPIQTRLIMGTFTDNKYRIFQSPFHKSLFHTNATYDFIFNFVNQWIKKQESLSQVIEDSIIRDTISFNIQTRDEIEFTVQSQKHNQTYVKLLSLQKGYSTLPRKMYLKSIDYKAEK